MAFANINNEYSFENYKDNIKIAQRNINKLLQTSRPQAVEYSLSGVVCVSLSESDSVQLQIKFPFPNPIVVRVDVEYDMTEMFFDYCQDGVNYVLANIDSEGVLTIYRHTNNINQELTKWIGLNNTIAKLWFDETSQIKINLNNQDKKRKI